MHPPSYSKNQNKNVDERFRHILCFRPFFWALSFNYWHNNLLCLFWSNPRWPKSYSKVEWTGALNFCLYASSIYVIHGWLDFHPSTSLESSKQAALCIQPKIRRTRSFYLTIWLCQIFVMIPQTSHRDLYSRMRFRVGSAQRVRVKYQFIGIGDPIKSPKGWNGVGLKSTRFWDKR